MRLFPMVLLFVSVAASAAIDKSHCGPNGFSPPAPDWICNAPEEVNQVPEPGSLALVALALVAMRILRRKQ